MEILTEPKNALIKQYQKLFRDGRRGAGVSPRRAAGDRQKALARKTGARGLRSILEQALLDTMYELPSMENVSKVVIDEADVHGEGKPLVDLLRSPKAALGSLFPERRRGLN